MINKSVRNIVADSLIGLATGDAVGVPVEFLSRKQIRSLNITDMIGIDTHPDFAPTHGQPAGTWSDDTSMTIAAMDAIARNNGRFTLGSVMRAFCDWWYNGLYCVDKPFDIGRTCLAAIQNFNNGTSPLNCALFGLRDNGNGSLMRILPFALTSIFKDAPFEDMGMNVCLASCLTHGHGISMLGCVIFTVFLSELLTCDSRAEAWDNTRHYDYGKYFGDKYFDADTMKAYETLLSPDFVTLSDDVIGETGYVVDTLMAAVKSLLCTSTYEDAIMYAVRLGFDTDTNAAVTGALAGAYYGMEAIPERWLAKLRKKDMLLDIAGRFASCF